MLGFYVNVIVIYVCMEKGKRNLIMEEGDRNFVWMGSWKFWVRFLVLKKDFFIFVVKEVIGRVYINIIFFLGCVS